MDELKGLEELVHFWRSQTITALFKLKCTAIFPTKLLLTDVNQMHEFNMHVKKCAKKTEAWIIFYFLRMVPSKLGYQILNHETDNA